MGAHDRSGDGADEIDLDRHLDDDLDSPEEPQDPARRSRVLRFAKRLIDRKELAEDTRDLLYAVVSTSDKAKTEAVRMVAREVRHYLDELRLKEDVLDLMTGYSLEISVHLKPLADAIKNPEGTAEAPPEEPAPESEGG